MKILPWYGERATWQRTVCRLDEHLAKPAHGMRPVVAREEDLPGSLALSASSRRVARRFGQRPNEALGIAGFDVPAEVLVTHDLRKLAVRRAEVEQRTSGGEHAVEFAWYEKPLEARLQRSEMKVRRGQALGQAFARLVRKKPNVRETGGSPLGFGSAYPVAHEREDELGYSALETPCGLDERQEFVAGSEVAAVHRDEAVLESMRSTKPILVRGDRGDRRAIGPVLDHAEARPILALRENARRHALGQDDAARRRAVTCLRRQAKRPGHRVRLAEQPEGDGHLGVDVLNPRHERNAPGARDGGRGDRQHRRRRQRKKDVRALDPHEFSERGRPERTVVGEALGNAALAEARRPRPAHLDAAQAFPGRQPPSAEVGAAARHHGDLVAARDQILAEFGQELRGRRVIRRVELIDR